MNFGDEPVCVLPAKITRYQSGVQKCVVNAYFNIKEEAKEEDVYVSHTDIIVRVSKLLNIPPTKIDEFVKRWKGGEPLKTPGKKRKRKSPVTDVDTFTSEGIVNKIYSKLRQGETVTVKSLLGEVKNDASLAFQGSETSLRRLLKKWGFAWGRGEKFAHIRESEDIIFKRSCFLRQYIKYKDESSPRPFVFLDETWIYMNGESTKTWLKPNDLRGQPRRPEEGSRLVVIHAGSREGFVPGAGLIFHTKLKAGQDYHGAMNGNKFQRWVETQLIPGLETLGPCTVVMDNAPYHSKILDPQPTTKWRKEELLTWLNDRGINVPPQPTVVELRAICRIHRSSFKRYVIDEMLKENGHRVLRLPPYHCIFNAIEEVWSETKHHYSSHVAARPGTGFDRAKSVWQEALNRVTKEKWIRYIGHVEKVITEYWTKEVKDVPEVAEIEISLSADDEDDDEDDEDNEREPLALPLP